MLIRGNWLCARHASCFSFASQRQNVTLRQEESTMVWLIASLPRAGHASATVE